jgi:hypothetical protein
MQIPPIIDIQKHIILLYFQINWIVEYKIIPFDPQQLWNWLIINNTKYVPPLRFRQHKDEYLESSFAIIHISPHFWLSNVYSYVLHNAYPSDHTA